MSVTETIQRVARAVAAKHWPEPEDQEAVWESLVPDVETVIETLLDLSEEAVEAALNEIETDLAYSVQRDRVFGREVVRDCIRAYHRTILGREE